MKKVLVTFILLPILLFAQGDIMVIHQSNTSNNSLPIILNTSEIDSITFNDDTECVIISATKNAFSLFNTAQTVYDAETGVYCDNFTDLGLENHSQFSNNPYFTFAVIDTGILEAKLIKDIGEFPMNAIIGYNMGKNSYLTTPTYYGRDGFDSTTVSNCYEMLLKYR